MSWIKFQNIHNFTYQKTTSYTSVCPSVYPKVTGKKEGTMLNPVQPGAGLGLL